MKVSSRQQQIVVALLAGNNTLPQLIRLSGFAEITERTLQRDLNELIELGIVSRQGEARAISYTVVPKGKINLALSESQLETFLANEDRPTLQYDFDRLESLRQSALFAPPELLLLDGYNSVFQQKLQTASPDIIRRERERITIELSWKSSQFEGNTYSLLETETLLKDGIPAKGKTPEETTMVLNHKKL
ncbi:hypothetical protein IPG36_04830 [bacterium]|nr:MAG: hypothetical protein IPG36_04830 [bacterium]